MHARPCTHACALHACRAHDTDASIRTAVSKHCSEMWFLDGATIVTAEDDAGGAASEMVARPAQQRALDLADICYIM